LAGHVYHRLSTAAQQPGSAARGAQRSGAGWRRGLACALICTLVCPCI
jgi:hypothetical protein